MLRARAPGRCLHAWGSPGREGRRPGRSSRNTQLEKVSELSDPVPQFSRGPSTFIIAGMRGTDFDEIAFFRAIQEGSIRALLIGRRALVLLGLPLLTADYDFWISIDDIVAFNAIGAVFDLVPTFDPETARRRGRYALENDEHVDVLVARAAPTTEGTPVKFDDVWARRQAIPLGAGLDVQIPAIEDLILTKRFASRPKDLEDIRLLMILKAERG